MVSVAHTACPLLANGSPRTLDDAEAVARAWIETHVSRGEQTGRRERYLAGPTFESFARKWLDGELHRQWPDHVKLKSSAKDDRGRLERYVFPQIGTEPISSFEGDRGLDLAEEVSVHYPVAQSS